jgi:UDP-hydrolysing UDP-N-acetyl-D-glucosamine 2-epimerase
MTRKICVVVTARPSYSRIKSALRAVAAHPHLELHLVVAASALLDRYGNTVQYIEQDGFQIAARAYTVLEGENLVTSAKSTGLGLVELATVFDGLKPDVVVTVADRYETLATAVAASYLNIPLLHVQGGEVTGSIDEKVRHAVTKLSDLHCVSTQLAAERVIRMGEEPATVFVTGCPSIDVAASIVADPTLDFDPLTRYGGVGPLLDLSGNYIVVMQHPVTTEYEQARCQIMETLHAIEHLNMPTLWFWPNVDAGSDGVSKGIRMFREQHPTAPIHFFRNMQPEDFLKVAYNSRCIVGNSSVAIRECSFLGIPAVNIGTRQAGRERGHNVVDVDHDRRIIADAVRQQVQNGHLPADTIYGDGAAGVRIADVLSTSALSTQKRLAY